MSLDLKLQLILVLYEIYSCVQCTDSRIMTFGTCTITQHYCTKTFMIIFNHSVNVRY